MDKRVTIQILVDGMSLAEAEELEEKIREMLLEFPNKRITISSREISGPRIRPNRV